MMSQKEKLNVGILGCGPIAQFAHLEACNKAANVNLHSVCDIAVDLANKMGKFYGASKVYYNYDEMLNDQSIDAVIVATNDAFHHTSSLKALESGKHVLVEKPLGSKLDKARALKKIIDKSELTFQVGHMKRFDAGIDFAKSFVQNEMGEMIAYKGWYCDSSYRYDMTDSTQPLVVKDKNAKRPPQNPKADLERYYMLAHGSHLVDTARFLAGKIKSVNARLVRRKGIFSWFIDTDFANGANGHLDLTVAVQMDWHEGFHIYGEKGSSIGKIYNPWYFKVSDVECFSEKDKKYHRLLDNKAHFFQLQLEAFAGTILHGTPQKGTDINEGIESIQAMIAISQSVKLGEKVYLKDVNGVL